MKIYWWLLTARTCKIMEAFTSSLSTKPHKYCWNLKADLRIMRYSCWIVKWLWLFPFTPCFICWLQIIFVLVTEIAQCNLFSYYRFCWCCEWHCQFWSCLSWYRLKWFVCAFFCKMAVPVNIVMFMQYQSLKLLKNCFIP